MPKKKQIKPVFYDPKRHRWWWFLWFVKSLAVWAAVVAVMFIINIVKTPKLPSLPLDSGDEQMPNQVHHLTSLTSRKKFSLTTIEKEREFQETKQQLNTLLQKGPRFRVRTSSASAQTRTDMVGFFVNWDDTSFTSLKKNIGQIDVLIPEWLHVSDDPNVAAIDDPDKEKNVLDFVAKQKPNLKILALINNFNSDKQQWDEQRLTKLLSQPSARTANIQFLLYYIQDRKLAGVTIDYENVPASLQPNLQEYMQELYQTFHPLGLQVTQAVPADDNNFNLQELGKSNDYFIIMMYDEHWDQSPAGPVASQGWFDQVIGSHMNTLPPNKFVIALGMYGYDWPSSAKTAEVVTFQQTMQRVRDSKTQVSLDPISLNPSFQYLDGSNTKHTVWYLNAVTIFNEMRTSRIYQPRGWALWRLGTEDPSVWNVIEHRGALDKGVADSLQTTSYGYDVNYQGQGEVLRVTATPQSGTRQITYDNSLGLITGDTLVTPPLPYVITRMGGEDPKKVVLTFDDGPDPLYTPQILDILKKYQVPAAFFVVGSNADRYPDLLQRIYAEGHEIGNHTFTHPNLSLVPAEQWKLEINSTERLFESRLGRNSLLFRPPYAEDVEPETSDQVRPLVYTSQLGYYTIGMNIDPKDWTKPGVDTIVNSTVAQLEETGGNIILLHDSGGDRSQTVAALPKLIETLQAKGYHFSSVAQLLDLKRDDLMPPTPIINSLQAQAFVIAFVVLHWFGVIVPDLFLAGIVLGVLRLVLLGSLALLETAMNRKKVFTAEYQPSVTVVIPAYNEEKVVVHTVHSVLASSYQNFDVIVVDDGSTDGTYKKLLAEFAKTPQVKIFRLPNQGKAHALNFGIGQTQAEIVIALDADTTLHPDAISLLIRHFSDPQIGAVAGNAKVGNRHNLLTKWQALEYITSQNLDRRAFALLNCVTIVPGAIGAWRRDLVQEVGGFQSQTLAEDADLTLHILRKGYRIAYEDAALAYTEAPSTIRAFLKQRFRWTYGMMQVTWKNRNLLFSWQQKVLGFIALPNIIIFQIFFPLISPILDFLLVSELVTMFWTHSQHPENWNPAHFQKVLFYYLLFVGIDFFASFLAFTLEKKEDFRLLFWLFWQRFFYRQLMYFVVVKSTLTALRGGLVGWSKIERQGLKSPKQAL